MVAYRLRRRVLLPLLVTAILSLLAACVAPVATPATEAPADASAPASDSAAAASGEAANISISGAFALFPMVTVWAEEYQKLNPNVTFDIQGGGAGKGMTDMLTGAADIAMLSREARQEELDQGSFLVPVTIDAVIGTFNANNPYVDQVLARGITPEISRDIWISSTVTTWGQWLGTDATETINVYTRSDSAGAAEMWSKFSTGATQEDLKGIAVNGDPGLAEAVRQDPLGVGFNNIGFTYDPATGVPNEGLQVIPIDLNGNGQIDPEEDFYKTRDELTKAIADKVFPFPPARELYLVTKGEPSPAITAFYRWILTDGQAFVADAGYVALPPDQLQAAQALLDDE